MQDPLSTIARMAVMPALLQALCKLTGMGVAAVARQTERSWIVCAVHDDADIGVKVGQQIDVRAMLGYECHVTVPIVAADGDVIGSLCVRDAKAVTASQHHIEVVVNAYAELISQHLKSDDTRHRSTEQRRVSAARSANHYVGVLADSLRMPLKAIGSYGDHLKHRSWDPALLEFSNRIDDNVRRISALLDSALDFARGQRDGGIDLQLTEVADVAPDLQEALQLFLDENPGSLVISNIPPTGVLRCDAFRLQQLTTHLLVNALRHGSPGRAISYVALVEQDDLLIEVWNDGEAIAAKDLPKVFMPFWRGETASGHPGTGMGLHICSQIARAHGGSIVASSSKHQGTTFSVRIPRTPDRPHSAIA